MSDPAFTSFGFDDGFGVTLSWGFAVLFVVSLIGAYLVLKIFDRYFRTEISEQSLARIIASLEQGQARRQTIFAHMTEEERQNVLEKVLLRKPYTHDILDGIKSEREQKALSETEEGKDVTKDTNDNDAGGDEVKQVEKHESDRKSISNDDKSDHDDQSKDNNTNILQKIGIPWPKFSNQEQSQSDEKDENDDSESEEDYDHQCLICMDSYEIGTDVAVGHKCIHMYHTRCLLKWMCAKHDFCPICHKYLFDVKEFKDVAQAELTKVRFHELVQRDHPSLVAMYMSSSNALIGAAERANRSRSISNLGDDREWTNREPENNRDTDTEVANREVGNSHDDGGDDNNDEDEEKEEERTNGGSVDNANDEENRASRND